MDPIPGAIAAYEELATMFDTYILSTAPWGNPSAWSDKLLWVKDYLGKSAYKRLILSHHKNLNDGDFLVDDRLKNGVDRFKGEHIHFATPEFPSWETVVPYLRARA
jgi:5'(3')-deoxyribonucleotidase